jgi:SAM-dependent methyltransferase
LSGVSDASDVRDPASFRDPAGYVVRSGERILRIVTPVGIESWNRVVETGAVGALEDAGFMVKSQPQSTGAGIADAALVLEAERIPFISYPYEWSFGQLRAAALLTLDAHLLALDHNATFSDASAYNVQFVAGQPVLIDMLSVVPYSDGAYWDGYTQFCRHFLNPLLLTARCGVDYSIMLRSDLEGIDAETVDRLLGWRSKLAPSVFWHVHLAARFQRRARSQPPVVMSKTAARRPLPRQALRGLLSNMRNLIAGLSPSGHRQTIWGSYAEHNTYAVNEQEAKKRFLAEAVAKVKPAMALDLGCNTGEYSAVMAAAGAGYVVGLDNDPVAIDRAYAATVAQLRNCLPLHTDLANPSPAQGWRGQERQRLEDRGKFGFVAALAVLHHLVIGRNVPLDDAIGWIMSLAPAGVIEWVEKSDQTVQLMLANRRDIFVGYTHEAFLEAVSRRAAIVRSEQISAGGRTLIAYQR